MELLDLLDATDVNYYEGCLIVEVQDHRGLSTMASAGVSDNHTAGNMSTQGINSNPFSHSILGKRGSDGVLKPSSMSLSSSDANIPSSSGSSNANFNKRFMTSYKRFEQARQEAATFQVTLSQRKQPSSKQDSASQSGLNESSHFDTGNSSSSVHSAVAAAVASASSLHVQDGSSISTTGSQKPQIYRVVLAPDIETVWTDLLAMKEEKRAHWSDAEVLEIEARVLVRFYTSIISNCSGIECVAPFRHSPLLRSVSYRICRSLV